METQRNDILTTTKMIALITIAVLLFGTSVLGGKSKRTIELIGNPGFEDSSSDLGSWSRVSQQRGFNIGIDTTVRHNGKNSLKMEGLKHTPNWSIAGSNRIAFDDKQQYRLSMWIKKESPGHLFKVRLQTYNAETGKRVFYIRNVLQTGWLRPIGESPDDNGWQQYVCENIIIAEKGLTLQVQLCRMRDIGKVWIDDVSLTAMEDDTFPMTDLSGYDINAQHPVLWDFKSAIAALAADPKAKVISARDRRRDLNYQRQMADKYVDDPDWTTQGEPGTIRHRQTAEYLRYIGHVYVLTGEKKYFNKVKQELLDWAKVAGPNGEGLEFIPSGGKWVAYCRLCEDYMMHWMAEAYDNIYEELSQSERDLIENNFFRPAMANLNIKLTFGGNRSIKQTGVTAIVGFVLGDMTMIRHGFHTIGAFDYTMKYSVGRNGSWLGDGSSGYINYSFSTLGPLIDISEHVGIGIYENPQLVKLLKYYPNILLPDGSDPGYGDGSWANRKNWRPYEKFKARRPELAKIDYTSQLYPDLGYAVLREGAGSEEIYVGFTYGLQSGHSHPDKLGLFIYGNDQKLAPDSTSCKGDIYEYELYFCFFQKTLSHNLVMVDQTDLPKAKKGRILHFFEAAPKIKTASSTSNVIYPGISLRRTLTLTNGYILDLFRCSSDKVHRYDWVYHNLGKLRPDRQLQPWAGPIGFTGGFQYLEGIGSKRTAENWSADWRLQNNKGLKLLMAGAPDTEAIMALGPSRRKKDLSAPKLPAVIVRRNTDKTTYITTLEPYRRRQPKVRRLTELRPRAGPDAGTAVMVTRKTGTDYFGLSFKGDKQLFTDSVGSGIMTLNGDFGAVSLEGKKLQYISLVNGTSLTFGDVAVFSSRPTTIYAEMVSDRILRVDNRGQCKASISAFIGSGGGVKVLDTGKSFNVQVPLSVQTPEVAMKPWPVKAKPAQARIPLAVPIKAGVNLVSNPGIEDSENGKPKFWTPFNIFPGTKFERNPVSYDNTTGHTGTGSLKMGVNKIYGSTNGAGTWAQNNIIANVGSGGTFEVSAWVRSDTPTKVRMSLYGYEPGWGRDTKGAASQVFTADSKWKKISHTNTFKPGTTNVSIALIRSHQINGGEVWFDDIEVKLLPQPANKSIKSS